MPPLHLKKGRQGSAGSGGRSGDQRDSADDIKELSFEDRPPPRIGDTRSRRKDEEEFPPERVEEAGRTGGEIPQEGLTADDLSPETLLDDLPSHTPAAEEQRVPLDTVLREVGPEEAAVGYGEDEAEQALRDPVYNHESSSRGSHDERHRSDHKSGNGTKRPHARHPFKRGRSHRRRET